MPKLLLFLAFSGESLSELLLLSLSASLNERVREDCPAEPCADADASALEFASRSPTQLPLLRRVSRQAGAALSALAREQTGFAVSPNSEHPSEAKKGAGAAPSFAEAFGF